MNINELDQFNLGDAVRFHNRLNPRLWGRDEQLHPEVRQALLAIADDFKTFLGIEDLEIKDITISGSNAAYNYTPHSDIDLHLVVDMPKMNSEVYRELFNAKKYQYNDQHDITIGDADVELYVQPIEDEHHSQGIYSVLDNQWVSVPRRKRARVDDISVRHKYEDLVSRIDAAIASGDETVISNLVAKIKNMRATGLAENGEFGAENLAFKMLRTQGYIQKLYDALNTAHARELSLRERARPVKKQHYGFGNVTESHESVESEKILQRFAGYCADYLGLQDIPKMTFHHTPEWSERTGSFGQYDPDRHVLILSLHGRHILDVLRTMAHELTHAHQEEREGIPDGGGATGSQWENEANAQAGIMMRHFADQHPEYFRGVDINEDAPATQPQYSHEYYDQLAQKYAKEHNVPLSMVRHVMQKETGHIEDANKRASVVSKRGAQGVMQLMPVAQKTFGVTNPNDPDQNVRAGVQYLGQQLTRWKDPVLAMAAYNAGPSNVAKYGGVPPFKQTQNYVAGYTPDPVKPMAPAEEPSVLANLKNTGYEWLRSAGDAIDRAVTPKNLDPKTMQPLKEKVYPPYKGSPPEPDPRIDPLRDRLSRGENPKNIEAELRKNMAADAERVEHELRVQRAMQQQLKKEKQEIENKILQQRQQEKDSSIFNKQGGIDLIKAYNKVKNYLTPGFDVNITKPTSDAKSEVGRHNNANKSTLPSEDEIAQRRAIQQMLDQPVDALQSPVKEQDDDDKPPPQDGPSIQKGLNFLRQLHGLSKITSAGAREELIGAVRDYAQNQAAQDLKKALPPKQEPVQENASGYIPTKKQARDPRYSMALTVDIKPGQVGKEANKMALQTDSQGRPALLMPSLQNQYRQVKESTGVRLKDLCTVKTKLPDADFWLRRSGSEDTVGEVLTEYNPDAIGIKVNRTDVLNPSYAKYMFVYLHQQGQWKQRATGSTQLAHIRAEDVANISVGG